MSNIIQDKRATETKASLSNYIDCLDLILAKKNDRDADWDLHAGDTLCGGTIHSDCNVNVLYWWTFHCFPVNSSSSICFAKDAESNLPSLVPQEPAAATTLVAKTRIFPRRRDQGNYVDSHQVAY